MMALNKTLIALAFALALTANTENTAASHQKSANPVDYAIDAGHTQVLFTYSHFGFSNITGRFTDATGVIRVDPDHLASASVDVSIPVASLSTGVAKLDTHLLAADFFNAADRPTATFKSDQVTLGQNQGGSPQTISITGPLTINGVTKVVTFNATVNRIAEHPMKKVPAIGFDATTTILRSDFGLGAYAPAVSDEVVLRITVEALAKPVD